MAPDKTTEAVRTIDFVAQLAVAAAIPLGCLFSFNFISSTGLSSLQSLCLLVAGPLSVVLLLLLWVGEFLFSGLSSQGWPWTVMQTTLLLTVTFVCRTYLLRQTVKFGFCEKRRLGGHFLNLTASAALALLGLAFIAMTQQ